MTTTEMLDAMQTRSSETVIAGSACISGLLAIGAGLDPAITWAAAMFGWAAARTTRNGMPFERGSHPIESRGDLVRCLIAGQVLFAWMAAVAWVGPEQAARPIGAAIDVAAGVIVAVLLVLFTEPGVLKGTESRTN